MDIKHEDSCFFKLSLNCEPISWSHPDTSESSGHGEVVLHHENMRLHSPFFAVTFDYLPFVRVNKMYVKATSCLHLHPQLLLKDLGEKEKKQDFFISFQHKQSSAKSESQMHQKDENPCKSGNDCVSLLQTGREINNEENTEKPEEFEFFS